mgnify:CR=1 FL=1
MYGRYSPLYDTFYGDKMLKVDETSTPKQLLEDIANYDRQIAYSIERLQESAVYRFRYCFERLECAAEFQWIQRGLYMRELTMQRLAENYPDFTADWLRC